MYNSQIIGKMSEIIYTINTMRMMMANKGVFFFVFCTFIASPHSVFGPYFSSSHFTKKVSGAATAVINKPMVASSG